MAGNRGWKIGLWTRLEGTRAADGLNEVEGVVVRARMLSFIHSFIDRTNFVVEQEVELHPLLSLFAVHSLPSSELVFAIKRLCYYC
jgi:hypothetical protein